MVDEIVIGQDGQWRLPSEGRWHLAPGARFLVRETPEGLLLRPLDPPLTKVIIEPTSECNLSCRTCARHSWTEPTGSMAMATYRRLADGLREIPSLRTISLWGFGEPLLHPDILEMVSLAKGLGASVELITNGILLDRSMVEGLIAAGLDRLIVSVDGVSERTYGDIRRGGNLSGLQANLKALRSVMRRQGRDKLELGLEFVAMRRNIDDLPGLRRLARAVGAGFIIVSNVLPYTEDLKDEILYQTSAGVWHPEARYRSMPEVTLPRFDPRPTTLRRLVGVLDGSRLADPVSGAPASYCRFIGQGSVTVAWDGQVSPCVALMRSYDCYVLGRKKHMRRFVVGNVADQDILAIWRAPEYAEFRARVQQFPFAPCTDCLGCQLAETNERDCAGYGFPVCGDCLWAKGVILCP